MTPDTWNEQDFQFFFIPLFGIRQITKTCLFPRPTQVVKVHDPEKRDTDKDVESSRETTERVQSVEHAHEETENTSGQCNLEGCLDTNERKEVLSRFDNFLPFNQEIKKPSICLVEIGCRILNVLPFHHSAPLATEHADEEKDVETSCNTEEYENTGQSKMVWLCETLFYFSRKVD